MKAYVVFAGAALSIGGICFSFADDESKPAAAAALGPQAADAEPADAKAAPKPDASTADDGDQSNTEGDPTVSEVEEVERLSEVPEKYRADEKLIVQTHENLIKAYCSDDAKAVAALFTEEGEYVNADGEAFRGREEIQTSLAGYLEEHSGCKLQSDIEDIRFVAPTVAMVDGRTSVEHSDMPRVTSCKYHAVYTKVGDQWLISSIRDQAHREVSTHEERLSALDFLNGEWVDEDGDSQLSFNCRPVDNGKFLVREFSLRISGNDVMTGTQRIGWDPLSGQLRTWIFDSEGGFAEGIWEEHEDFWTVQAAGVTADGRMASGTSIYRIVDDHTMTWQSVDHEIDGNQIPDSPVFTLSRRAPAPGVEPEPKSDVNASAK